MEAGRLDRRLTIESNEPIQDQFGSMTAAWLPFATVWGRVSPVSGTEPFKSDQVTAAAATKFRIRWIDGLTESMRIVYNGRNYNIKNIFEIGRREGFDVLAQFTEGENDN